MSNTITGRALEIGVRRELDDGTLLVIHAMDLREKYRGAEADADAIEAGDVEVDETRVLYPRGRPSLSEPRTHSPRVDTRVPRGIKTQLRHLAEQQHRDESDVVRDAIEEYLARH